MRKRICTLLLLVLGYLLPVACQNDKDATPTPDEPISISSARKWFSQNFDASKLRVAQNGNLKSLNWDKASYYDFPFGKAVVVPISYQKALTPQYSIKDKKEGADKKAPKFKVVNSDLDNLIIHKNKEGKLVERIFRVIPDEDYLVRSNGRKKNIPFEGMTVITDWSGDLVAGYKYEKGKSVKNIVSTKQMRMAAPSEVWCETVDWYTCGSGDGGASWYCRYDRSETSCYGSGGGAPDQDYNAPDYAGGGGGSSSGDSGQGGQNYVANNDIITDISDPKINCVYAKIQNNATMNHFLYNFMGQNGAKVDLILKSGPNSSGSADIWGSTFTVPTSWAASQVEVNLDPSVTNNLTSLEIALAFLHEAAHAKMFVELLSIGGPANLEQNKANGVNFSWLYEQMHGRVINQHEVMADHYLNFISVGLSDFDGAKKSLDYYKALAWAGLRNTTAWANNPDKAEIERKRAELMVDRDKNCN